MKAGETLYHKGKAYIARPNLVQILFNYSSCEGCEINHIPSSSVCPLEDPGVLFLCGNLDAPKDEQVIFVEKV